MGLSGSLLCASRDWCLSSSSISGLTCAYFEDLALYQATSINFHIKVNVKVRVATESYQETRKAINYLNEYIQTTTQAEYMAYTQNYD